jgi:hypothetical protein
MKKCLDAILLIFITLAGFSCSDAKITYGGTNCTGAVETTETFSRTAMTSYDLPSYDYFFDYTSFSLGILIENACPTKPIKLNFSCSMEPVDSLPLYVGLSVYSGRKTQLGTVDLKWDATLSPNKVSGSGEFSAEKKSDESSFQMTIEFMVPFSDVNEARNYLVNIFREYTLTATYSKLQ